MTSRRLVVAFLFLTSAVLGVVTVVLLRSEDGAETHLRRLSHADTLVVVSSIEALAELRSTAAIPKLVTLLRSAEFAVQRAAHAALVRIGEPSVAELLRALRSTDLPGSSHVRVASCLAELSEPALPSILELLRHENATLRARAALTLGLMSLNTREVSASLRRAFIVERDGDVLGRLGFAMRKCDGTSLQFLRRRLASSGVGAKLQALVALRAFGADASPMIPTIEELAKRPELRQIAEDTLRQIR